MGKENVLVKLSSFVLIQYVAGGIVESWVIGQRPYSKSGSTVEQRGFYTIVNVFAP